MTVRVFKARGDSPGGGGGYFEFQVTRNNKGFFGFEIFVFEIFWVGKFWQVIFWVA